MKTPLISVMKTPLISVVLPIYNIEAYLDRCMEAVLGQTYRNLEILMVDDGSPDGCPAMCDAYAAKDPRVIALHKENGGLSDARNYGIARARGEYITCIDPDDYVDADYVEYLYGLIDKYGTKMSICQATISSTSKHAFAGCSITMWSTHPPGPSSTTAAFSTQSPTPSERSLKTSERLTP